jgi:hypothetical protein
MSLLFAIFAPLGRAWQRLTVFWRVVTALLALAVVVGGCYGLSFIPDPNLAELKGDAMARYVPPGARLERSSETEDLNSGRTRGQDATLTRVFLVPAALAARDEQATVAAALAAGWKRKDGFTGDGLDARKQYSALSGRLKISVDPSTKPFSVGVAGAVLTVAMRIE